MPAARPLIAGTGAESTKATIAACKRAANLGADGALVRTPSFFKNMMTTDVFVQHYVAVAEESPVPVLLYNVTMFTSVTLPPDAVGLLAEHPNVVGIKDSGTDIALLADYVSKTSPHFFVLSGSGATYFSGLVTGAQGASWRWPGSYPITARKSATWWAPAGSTRRARCSDGSRRWPGPSAACTACRR